MRNRYLSILIFLVSTGVSLCIAGLISEKFFFDKLYNYKSINHGYRARGKNLSLEDFGKRGEDLYKLRAFSEDSSIINDAVLGTRDNGVFTVAVIGDSYVWGKGLREGKRFVRILERKLNTFYPTEIISLGGDGDNIVENYVKYKLISQQNPNVDLYIFGMVDNDLMMNKKNTYSQSTQEEFIDKCNKPIFFVPPYDEYAVVTKKHLAKSKLESRSVKKTAIFAFFKV